MLFVLAVVLLAIWLVAIVGFHITGALIQLLWIGAVIVVVIALINLFSGRRGPTL